jgi:uncharacterized protein (DUF305 family)
MDTRTLLSGLAGFFIGGLLVSVAATTFDKPSDQETTKHGEMSMSQMVDSLKDKSGDDYDKAFISNMIAHHQSAVDMAQLSADRAKHNEIKQLSQEIITAQEKEISEMKQWQMDWGYNTGAMDH